MSTNTLGPTLRAVATSLALLGLGACGGGGGSSSDNSAATGQGTVYVGLTDADGDFLRYEVDVVSIGLRRADGTLVEALPNATRLDFAQYVDLTEFFTAAQVPAGRYVHGEITLDYANADVQVEVGGVATPAVVRSPDGATLGRYTLDIELDRDHPLIVARGIPALLTVDFDLAASNQVDLGQSPPVVSAAPFLSADVDVVAEKEIRAHGPLLGTDLAAATYTIDVRPFHRHDGRFGEVEVHTSATTTFEIDGTPYQGSDGLAALAGLAPGTPTVAFGTLDTATRRFTAATVQAGSSVPGATLDALVGNVTARAGDVLTVRGALLAPRSGATRFHDEVTVTIGNDTGVRRRGEPGAALDGSAISVGQRVEILGELQDDGSGNASLDADPGRVRLLVTHLGGRVSAATTGQLRLDLASIDGRDPRIFDFTGTGLTPAVDADPRDYEITTGALALDSLEPGEAARVFGFVRPFGQAPDDFEAISIVDRAAPGGAALSLDWRPEGTLAPFASLGPDALIPDTGNPDIGRRHHLVVAGIPVDLASLAAAPTIAPATDGPARYAIAVDHDLEIFNDFAAFASRLAVLLDGSRPALALHAEGRYDRDAGVLRTRIVGVRLGADGA